MFLKCVSCRQMILALSALINFAILPCLIGLFSPAMFKVNILIFAILQSPVFLLDSRYFHTINPALSKKLSAFLTFHMVTICLLNSNVNLNGKPHLYLILSLDSTELRRLKFRFSLPIIERKSGKTHNTYPCTSIFGSSRKASKTFIILS